MTTNLCLIEEEKLKLADETKNKVKLTRCLFIQKNVIELVSLESPLTVCNGCSKYDETEGIVYACEYGGSRCKTKSKTFLAKLLHSSAKCKQCRCVSKVHKCIYYKTKRVQTMEVDGEITPLVRHTVKAIKIIQDHLQKLEKYKLELEDEQQQTAIACGKSARFVKSNAIISFNDAFERYLNVSIEELEQNRERSGNRDKLKRLNQMRLEHDTLDAFLKDTAHGRSKQLTPADVKGITENLYKLKHNGPMIIKEDGISKEMKSEEVRVPMSVRSKWTKKF